MWLRMQQFGRLKLDVWCLAVVMVHAAKNKVLDHVAVLFSRCRENKRKVAESGHLPLALLVRLLRQNAIQRK